MHCLTGLGFVAAAYAAASVVDFETAAIGFVVVVAAAGESVAVVTSIDIVLDYDSCS